LEACANKKSITETIAENVDKLASTIGGAINPLQGDKQYERIVPIPPVKIYSELPFRQVDVKNPNRQKAIRGGCQQVPDEEVRNPQILEDHDSQKAQSVLNDTKRSSRASPLRFLDGACPAWSHYALRRANLFGKLKP
jgi:hypothetical protein